MLINDILLEKTIFNPDVSWVDDVLRTVDFNEANGDLFELASMLDDAFQKYKITFETYRAKYNKDSSLPRKTGILGAEYIGGDPFMEIKISQNSAKLSSPFPDFANMLKQLIKHELIHHEQIEKGKTKNIGTSPIDDLGYYSDPYEIAAIASEMESELLRIENDPAKLIKMLRYGDKKLLKSDRYSLYLKSYKDEPMLWKKAFARMMKELLARINDTQK